MNFLKNSKPNPEKNVFVINSVHPVFVTEEVIRRTPSALVEINMRLDLVIENGEKTVFNKKFTELLEGRKAFFFTEKDVAIPPRHKISQEIKANFYHLRSHRHEYSNIFLKTLFNIYTGIIQNNCKQFLYFDIKLCHKL